MHPPPDIHTCQPIAAAPCRAAADTRTSRNPGEPQFPLLLRTRRQSSRPDSPSSTPQPHPTPSFSHFPSHFRHLDNATKTPYFTLYLM